MTSRDAFLPVNKQDLANRGWDGVDVVFITGDAYVDHPSFAAALLGRLIESYGWKVGIIAQPRWDRPDDFFALGRPRLCCMISSGAIDSMVAHYTANNKPRSEDPYSPGGKAGLRPDRALISYSSRARQAFGASVPIIIGGLEASLRKFAHYDYWSDRVRRSMLLDAKADVLVYGMGEYQTIELLQRLEKGEPIDSIGDIRGTATVISNHRFVEKRNEKKIVELPSYDMVSKRDPASNKAEPEALHAYTEAFHLQMLHENPKGETVLIQRSADRIIWCNPPSVPIDSQLFDFIHELPYTRKWHPDYDRFGGVAALKEVQFSITSNRGCFGSCSFCAITSHQGRMISVRSKESMVREAQELSSHDNFKGYIHDVGGPTANFQGPACDLQEKRGPCPTKFCLFPEPCRHLKEYHDQYAEKLRAIAAVSKVKKVFVRSGIRFDYLMSVPSEKTRKIFINQLTANHVSGQLKIAPEHIAPHALEAMGKSPVALYEQFLHDFSESSERLGLKQYCIPYFIAAHPGTTLEDSVELALYLKKAKFVPDQVQEFYPTPGTVGTCMYFTGLDPRPGKLFEPVYVPKGRQRSMQRALIHFHKPEHRTLVIEALKLIGRNDLVQILVPRYTPEKQRNKK